MIDLFHIAAISWISLHIVYTLCLKKNAPTLKRYSSELYRSILMILDRNIQKSLE